MGIICQPKLCNKNNGHRARFRVKDHRTSLPGPLIEKQHRVLGMHARLFVRLRYFYVQYRMRSATLSNHLKRNTVISNKMKFQGHGHNTSRVSF